ncbi:MAG: hypothetical protein ING75_11720 [Rhodocyclaceae bacterium]|nr:hypothetical protein [Rhodocyclaceae bacterium]
MTTTPSQRHLATAIAVALYGVGTTAALAQSAPSKPPQQVVKPPIALAYIDVATASSDMPGGNMMGAAAQGGSSGGLFGALGGLARGAAVAATSGGNTFGQTRSMGFGSGRYVDVSVYTNKNRSLADATQMIPAAMNLGESLKLVAPIPEKPVPVGPVDEKPYEPSYEKPKGKMSIYWGCGETIRPGQPRTLDAATARIEDFGKFFVARGSTTKGARAEPGHPAWPNKQDDRQVTDSASLVGQHSFIGTGLPESFKVSLGAPQDLMPPLQLSQRRNESGFDLEWQSIPHARGYFIAVMGGKSDGSDSGEAIFWTSSELPDVGFGLLDYQSNTNIDKWIGEKVVLPPAATRCAVPKGIFPEGSGGMLRMIAYGSDAYFAFPPRPTDPKIAWEPEWQTKVRVKSTFFSILGGMGESEGRRRGTREEPAKAKEEKKPNPVELLKGLFGR